MKSRDRPAALIKLCLLNKHSKAVAKVCFRSETQLIQVRPSDTLDTLPSSTRSSLQFEETHCKLAETIEFKQLFNRFIRNQIH